MKVLLANRRELRLFFVFDADESINASAKIFYAFTALMILLAHFCAVAAGMAFFIKFASIDLEQSLYSLFNIFGDISVAYISIFLLVQRGTIMGIFHKISDIYEESKFENEFFSYD